MSLYESQPCRQSWIAALLTLAALLLAAPAGAQTVTVTSAVPDMADQGTLGLVVAISGDGFAKGAKVDFFVSGTTYPGGITVKSVKYKNPKALEATIDVAPDAQTSLKFDIQVTSGSRTGKGTELFKVLEKVTGGDLTPPGTITDLQAVEIGYNTAVFQWTAPADDGFLVESGPATKYDIRVRKDSPECGGPFTMDLWIDSSWTGPHADPCHIFVSWPTAGPAGTPNTHPIVYLAPNTPYWAAVRAVDDSPQGPNWSLLPEPSQQLHFATDPAPDTPWSVDVVDACPVTTTNCSVKPPRLDFDRYGNPALLYLHGTTPTLATWSGGTWPTSGGWVFETAPAIDGGNYAYDLAFDPSTGEATIASYVPSLAALRFYRRTTGGWQAETVATGFVRSAELGFGTPAGSGGPVPTIVYRYEKGSSYLLKVARRLGKSWIIDTVASGVTGGAVNHVHLAFDADADPAVAFIQENNGNRRLVIALLKGATWTLEALPDAPSQFQGNTPNFAELAFDPVRRDFSLVAQYRGTSSQVRYCERNTDSWSCGEEPIFQGIPSQSGLSLAVGDDGTVYVGTIYQHTLFVLVRDPASLNPTLSWDTEYVDWNANALPQDLHFGPSGQPTIVYQSLHDDSGAGGSDGNGSMSIAWKPLQ